jgi:hypothetical protein
MADGGELRAFFRAAQEDAAQAVENAAKAISDHIDKTAKNVLDSVDAIETADRASADAFNSIRSVVKSDNEESIASGVGGDNAAISSENGSPRLFNRLFPELAEINGPRFEQGPEWQHNCQSCVNAVDHTLDGSPASAVPVPLEGFPWPDSVIKTIGGGRPFVKVNGYDDITDQLIKAGDGARGVVWGRRFMQSGNRSIEVEGHVFNVVNRGGRVFYVDGQTGTFAKLANFGILSFLRTK